MSVKVLIVKVNKTYNIEVITSNDRSYSYYWRGDNLLDAYNSLYSELLKMNKLSDKIIFLYKTLGGQSYVKRYSCNYFT